jgi:hypothetical protein
MPLEFPEVSLCFQNRNFIILIERKEFFSDPKTCPCVGLSLSQAHLRFRSGALVLALHRADGTLIGGWISVNLYGNSRTITQFNSDCNPHEIGWFTFTETLETIRSSIFVATKLVTLVIKRVTHQFID